ncbi:MAG: hypothetical protein IPK67_18845 [Planctomycetes bacterium]|nr:hypothetical protein [Planctomycetota bacterium]
MMNFLSPPIDRAKVYLLAGLVVVGVVRNAVGQLAPATRIVSVGSGGTAGNNDAHMPRISRSGRYVTFASAGGYGLVGGNRTHIFVRDLGDDTLTYVSKTPAGNTANNDSFDPVISDDGRRVVFMSWATNLHPLDINGNADVYFHDRQTNKTYLVSATPAGFSGNNVSTDPEMTPDGRYVVFRSQATDLVASDANASFDVFRRDLLLEVTEIVSVDASGTQAAAGSSFCSISADGRWVAFQSSANNLVGSETDSFDDIFVKDMLTGAVEQISIRHDGTMMNSRARLRSFPTMGRRSPT